jgi:hypothetical protein
VWAKQADQGPNSLVGGARASRFLLIGGITPRNTKIGQVRLPGGRGSGDNGRSTFEVDEKKFLSVISFQLAEVAVSGDLFRHILTAIHRLRAPPVST